MTDVCGGSCSNCEGRCCTYYIVPITGYDLWRIVQAQRLAPSSFTTRLPEDYPTATGYILRPSGPTYSLALRHHEGRRNDIPCVFLMQLREGVQRCGIYDSRPSACRTYPMRLNEQRIAPRDDMLCPPDSWNIPALDRSIWRERVERQEWEWDLYGRVVKAWNEAVQRHPPTAGFVVTQYTEYLLNAYDHLEALRAESSEAHLLQQASEALMPIAHALTPAP